MINEITVYSEKSAPVLGVKNVILATGKKNRAKMECSTETIAFRQKSLYPWYGYEQIQIRLPKLHEGTFNVEGHENYFIFSNKGNAMLIDIPFIVKATTR